MSYNLFSYFYYAPVGVDPAGTQWGIWLVHSGILHLNGNFFLDPYVFVAIEKTDYRHLLMWNQSPI